jgi:hypothetical protein
MDWLFLLNSQACSGQGDWRELDYSGRGRIIGDGDEGRNGRQGRRGLGEVFEGYRVVEDLLGLGGCARLEDHGPRDWGGRVE